MAEKRKPTYAQALALQRAGDAARKSRRDAARLADQVPEQSAEQKAKWEAEKAEALRKYREAKARRDK